MADLRAHEREELEVLTAGWDAAARDALHAGVLARVGLGIPFEAALMLALAEVLGD